MKIDIDVPDGISGDWKVESFTVSQEEADFENLRASFGTSSRYIEPGNYKRLKRNGSTIMSNTPAEIDDCWHFIIWAEGNILINGLGLGVVLKALLNKQEVKSVTIIEKSEDVIKLVAPTYLKDNRVNIIQADALTWQPPKGVRYDFVWHDIWDNICADNLEEIHKLHRKYGRRTKWQDSWARDLIRR